MLHRSSSDRSSLTAAPPWQELRDRGFTVARGLLDEDQVRAGRELARRITTKQLSEDYQRRHASIGSLFDLLEDPASVELITWPRTFAVLGALGFPDPRYQHGIVFNKLPHTPRTFWHQDGISWNHPRGYEPEPIELIVIYYLVDTSPANGCLRVIPGSHRKRHPLHDPLHGSYTPDLRMMADPASPAFQTFADEVALPVSAGDAVIADARLLHAAHANESDGERTALSLWYVADCHALPEVVRARFTLEPVRDSRMPYVPTEWPVEAQRRLRAVLPPRYQGAAAPLALESRPGPALL